MELPLIRALLFVKLSLFALWNPSLSLQTRGDSPLQDYNDENVIDLLEALNVTRSVRGVTKVKGRDPGVPAWRFRSRAPHLTLPRDFSRYFVSSAHGAMGLHLIGRQSQGSEATLISLVSPGDGSHAPLLSLTSSTRSDWLRLEYRAEGGQGEMTFPGGSPFSGGGWVQLAFSLEPHRVLLYVDCREAVLWSDGQEQLRLQLPQDLLITFSSTAGERGSKFSGYWQTAEISTRAYLKRPWHCDNVTDPLPLPPPTQKAEVLEVEDADAPSMLLEDADSPSMPLEERAGVANDQPQRGGVLGPPSPAHREPHPQREPPPPGGPEQRISRLEELLEGMGTMLDMLKTQNVELQERVRYLESCECVRRTCEWEGREVAAGSRWVIDGRTVCTCTSGQVQCSASQDPCSSTPCLNGGVCLVTTFDPGFRCSAPSEVTGSRQLSQACFLPKLEGVVCRGGKAEPEQRWFFDSASASCEHFLFGGCGGNRNSFPTRRACQVQCMLGACCSRPLADHTQEGDHRHGHDQHGDSRHGYEQHRDSRHGYEQHGDSRHGCEQHRDGGNGSNASEPECSARMGEEPHEWKRLGPSDGRQSVGKARRGSPGGVGFNRTRRGWQCEGGGARTVGSLQAMPGGASPAGMGAGGAAAAELSCEYMWAGQCQLRARAREVLSFSPGRGCAEVACGLRGGCRGDDLRGCVVSGRSYRPGESFTLGCDACVCTGTGALRCTCPLPTQRKELRDLSQSERQEYQRAVRQLRPECSFEGKTYRNDEVFNPDPCSSCVCEYGTMQCKEVQCSSLSCLDQFVPKGECCPVCQPGCEYENEVYENGEVFVSRSNPCLNCSCTNSLVRCSPIHCPPAPCPNPYKRPGQCCPTCSACDLDGRPYNGSFSTIDGCQTCTCQDGVQQCVEVQQCPMVCADGVRPPFGSCCRDCSRCDLQGEVILDGVSFPDRKDACKRCVCTEGNVVCRGVPCPSLDCSLLETVGGECCPRCRSCVHKGVRHKHGTQWNHPDNPCSNCTCLEGRVRCEREECSPPCKNPPSPRPGACCPVCNDCGVNGLDFLNGKPVPSRDQCEECVCVNGDLHCKPLPCPATPCPQPIRRPGDCCPRCEQCEYESQLYEDGQSFASRLDPCLSCRCAAGEVVCERVDSACPSLRCSHPAKPRGQCCPTCDMCEYERRVYADGKVFNPPGSGPCLQCTCKGGSVRCHQKRCPPVLCSNPINDPQLCCPICKEGVEFEEGSVWEAESQPCSSCSCVDGNVVCRHAQCPPTACRHPSNAHGECCATCDRCSYNQRIYDNGQTFTDPDEPCQTCTCQDGSVQCNMMQCPAVSCPRPHTPAEQCCPQCPDCDFENRVFVNGEAFPSPVNPCEECVCADGRVDCHGHQCPTAPCHHPLPGSCCLNNCNGCSYAGKEYPNGMEFPHPTDTCRTCHCINGNVQCLMKRCPAQQCSDPRIVPGECCPQCPVPPADCVYEGQTYRHTQRFYHPTDSCQSCSCTNGTVGCRRRPCPPALCAHPLQQECCRTCDGCLYDGREHANGAVFADVSDTCGMCVCREGTVMCERRRCPAITCSFPTHGECCHTCDGCRYVGVEYLSRQEFADPGDQCSVCVCMSGQVTCSPKPCYSPGCSHPVTLHGTCCPVCNGCFYDNVVLLNGQAVPDPSDACSQCTCRAGSVQCVRRVCPVAPCPQPVSGPCDCPVCEGCLFQGGVHLDGESFPAAKSACEECTCSKGEVRCVPRSCPKVTCPHPGVDLCSCAVCDGCRFHGRECVSGERFLDPHDHCQRCTCLNGGVSCVPLSCPAVSCSRPVRRRGECCPVCTGACQHDRQQYQTGSTFTPPSQPCSTCTCLNEVVSCVPVSCPRQCSHPALSKGCCPACHACLYEGSEFTHRQTFSSPSDPCLRCTCLRGSVTCDPVPCPPISCPDPVTPPGHCCRECRVCVQHGVEYGEGQTWSPSNDLCSQCTCMAGVVSCVGPQCPKLSCMHQATEPDSCCPRCRGCVYEGDERAEGSVWFGSSTPCMSCMCVEGVTTCSEVRCLSPCLNHITVPGECCPVCADCIYDDQLYSPGESFHPSADPCQICTCEVMPDGEQHLRCYRKQCPSLVDCPKNNILFSGPDECCPVCAQPLSNCTATLIGNEVLATDDPCFTCQCKDLTWTCIHQACLPLSCPTKEQYTPPDSCCPVCDECVIEGERERVPNGESWTDSVDECITCTCNLGYIECDIEECTPLVCRDGLVKVKSPGQCCYECQDVSCVYQDQVFVSNEHWEVDECTACTCVAGDVHCHTERCPVVSCAADETPALIPGMCCPHCIPRPATCVAFGDPHYRTFDGKMVNFQGACTYVLAQDCEGGDFSIHGTNDDRGRKGVSWTKEVTVFIGDVIVQLLQDWVVMVDYQMVTLPYLREPYIYLERKTNTILLNTNLGLKVLWNGRSHLEISVPGTYKKHMCGLCGNFNSFPQDDTRLRNGHITTSDAAFGNDWKVQSTNRSNTACSDGLNVDPCKEAGYFARKTANARCGVLKSGVFERCHRVVPPEMFFAACVYDLCACGPNSDECVCDALEAYASECREAGVVLQWRSPSLCAVGCPVDRGFVFDECGPPCAVTCFNKEAALGEIEAGCFKPCVPGCQCPAGLVEHEAHCIPPERCPKVIYGNA